MQTELERELLESYAEEIKGLQKQLKSEIARKGIPYLFHTAVERCLKLAGIPPAWYGKNLDMLVSEEQSPFSKIILRLKDWDFKEPNVIFISGKAGTGKTHIAVALMKIFIIKHVIETLLDNVYQTSYTSNASYVVELEKYEWAFTNAFAKERWIYDAIRSADFDKTRFVEKIMRRPIFVIDDLFSDRETEFARSTMLGIIDERVDWHKSATIITSNFDLDYISANIDDRIASRLSTGISINITSQKDFRRE